MTGLPQIGIALGALGVVLTLMGLFPGVTGINAADGVGIVQFSAILIGYTLLMLGALLYVKFTFYVGRAATLIQQIGVRLTLTGLVFAGLVGLADFLGFGSHGIMNEAGEGIFGEWQAIAFFLMLMLAAIGVLVYLLSGELPPPKTRKTQEIAPLPKPTEDSSTY